MGVTLVRSGLRPGAGNRRWRRRAVAGVGAGALVVLVAACDLGAKPVVYDVPGQDVAAGDIDGDGDADLVSVGVPDLGILLNDGAGGFTTQVIDDGDELSRPQHVELADVDGDDHLDVVRSHYTNDGTQWHDGVDIQLGDGTGAFAAAYALPAPPAGVSTTEIYDLDVADMDGDGDADVVATFLDRHVVVYQGDGAGGFAVAQAVNVNVVFGTTLADVDADGDLDVVATGARDLGSGNREARLVVLRNDGTGQLGAIEQYLTDDPPNTVTIDATAGDIDDDGDVDLLTTVTTGDDRHDLVVFPGSPSGTFGGPYRPPVDVADGVSGLTTADVDRDGLPDLVVGNRDAGGSVHFSDGTGGLVDSHGLATEVDGTTNVLAGDLDDDGRTDLVFSGQPCLFPSTACSAPSVGVMMNELDARPED